ncbi:MAG: hypothetical protein PHO37_14495 [Kiritimatiellae bacterium]|nr:hypothetical protein [Kiritimatiellia bacterium]
MVENKKCFCVLYGGSVFLKWLLAFVSLIPICCFILYVHFSVFSKYEPFLVLSACVMLTGIILFYVYKQHRVVVYKEACFHKEKIIPSWSNVVNTALEEVNVNLKEVKWDEHCNSDKIEMVLQSAKNLKLDDMTALALFHPMIYFQVKKMEFHKSLVDNQFEIQEVNPVYDGFGRSDN